MPIEPVKTEEQKADESKPLLNIQLPAPMSGNPESPLSVGRHNAAAQHNFQQVANILQTIINNQKLIGMAVNQAGEKQKELEKTINGVSENIRKLLENKENKKDEKPVTATTNQ